MTGPGPHITPGRSGAAPQIFPKSQSVAEMRGLRHREMKSISNRLADVDKRDWATAWTTVGLLLWGGAIGGGIGSIPFLSMEPEPSHTEAVHYIGLLVIAAAMGTVCLIARLTVKHARGETVKAIKRDLDQLLEAYE